LWWAQGAALVQVPAVPVVAAEAVNFWRAVVI